MTKVTQTTNRLHFTDLSPTRFEDLSMQLVYRLNRWEEIHHDGRTGSDDGVDMRAIERLDDESLRHWHVQCRRYEKASAATLKAAVDDTLGKASAPPDVLLVVIACDVSLDARTRYEEYARAKGIETPMLWPASTLEAKLYTDHPDLLFAFFGISLARQERGRETMLKRNLVMKRRLTRIFTPKYKDQKWEVIVHSVDDQTYPEAKATSGWYKTEFCGLYYNGIELYVGIDGVVIQRRTGRWALIDYDLRKTVDEGQYFTQNAFRIARIPFRNIVECDEEGDEYYYGPHLYCKYADNGWPYESIVWKLTEQPPDGFYTLDPELQMPAVKRREGKPTPPLPEVE